MLSRVIFLVTLFLPDSDQINLALQTTFEQVYNRNKHQYNRWYILAGNHDYYGNISAQLAYSQRSDRWVFPSLYYKFSYKFDGNQTADFIVIDTVQLCGNTIDGKPGFFKTVGSLFEDSTDLPGPGDTSIADAQWTWIEQQLNTSTADYLFVVGHYPVYSVSNLGPTPLLVERLRPLLHKYRVTAYVAGHEHNIQLLINTENGTSVPYIISGAASRTDSSTPKMDKVPEGSLQFMFPRSWNPLSQLGLTDGAFIYTKIDRESAKFNVYDGLGVKHHEFILPKRT